MTTAKQIVEAEIGPQDDINDFVAGALKPDFLLARLDFKKDIRKPFVYDTVTDKIVCYMATHWAGNEPDLPCDASQISYRIEPTGTFFLQQSTLKRDPGYSNLELRDMGNRWFGSWQAAMRYFLSLEASQNWMREGLLIEATGQHINALGYRDRLEPLVQVLARRGVFVEKVERRAGKGTACYVLCNSETLEAPVVIQALQDSAALCGLAVENAKAAMRNERSWQIDFNVVNLFEMDDIEDFVTTAFREEVPGYAELERIEKYKTALRQAGLPVYKLEVTTFSHWTTKQPMVEIRAYWDNQVTNFSKGTVASMARKAARDSNYGVQTIGENPIFGHGKQRHVILVTPAIGNPIDKERLTIESDDDEYASFGEVAAAKQGTIGDELRLKRLVAHMKANGIKVGEASLRQHQTHGGAFLRYLSVEYKLTGIRCNRLSAEDVIAQSQIKGLIARFLNADRELTGAGPQPQSEVVVDGGHLRWNGFGALIHATSLRKPTDEPFEQMDTAKFTFEAKDGDYEEFGDVATNIPGLHTRMLLQKIRASLESKGMVVRNVHAVQWTYKLRVIAHINVAGASLEPDYKKFTREEVIQAWYKTVRECGSAVINDANELTRITVDGPEPLVYTIKGFIQNVAGRIAPDGTPFDESIVSLDDMGFGEHERAYSIMQTAEMKARTNPAIRPVAVLWARVEPVVGISDWAEGSTYMRFRCVSSHGDDAMWAIAKAVSDLGAEKVNGRSVPGFGRAKQMNAQGRILTDVYVTLKAMGEPLAQGFTIPGPSKDKWPQLVDLDEPNRMLETFDPEDEVWVQRVMDKSPGYKDLLRLKDAIREVEGMGVDVISAIQSRKKSQEDTGTVCEVFIAIRLPVADPSRQGTPGILADMKKITSALSHWDILDLRFEYDTTDVLPHRDRFRVFTWYWLSHDAPGSIVPLELRKGEWDEHLRSGLHHMMLETFLVEQFDEPGEEQDPYWQVFAGASDDADPLWRERMRLRQMADDLKAQGWHGNLHLQAKETSVNSPTLWFSLWRNEGLGAQGEMTDVQFLQQRSDEEYQFKGAIQKLNQKHQFTSPGNVWAHLHDVRNQIAAKRPGNVNLGNVYAWQVSFPYMYGKDTNRAGVDPIPIQQAQVHIHIDEAIDFSPQEMGGFMRVAGRPDKLQVVKRAFKAFVDHFKQQFPHSPSSANYLQEPQPGGFSRFEFYAKLSDPQVAHTLMQDRQKWDVKERIANGFRDAVLKSGLKRYTPRRKLYYRWPSVDVYQEGTDMLSVICKFSLKGVQVPDRTDHISDIHAQDMENYVMEAWEPDDIEGFVGGALPDLGDTSRLKTMLDQWAQFSNYVIGGAAWTNPNTTTIRRGQRRPPYTNRADIHIQAIAKHDDLNTVGSSIVRANMSQELLQLLANHGFGQFIFDDRSIGNHIMKVGSLYLTRENRNGWSIDLTGADVKAKSLKVDVSFGDLTGIAEALDWTPDDIAGIASKATKRDLVLSDVHDGFRHMVDALKAALPGQRINARIGDRDDLYDIEGGRYIEFTAGITVPEGFFKPVSIGKAANLAHNVEQKQKVSDLVREAIHQSRLAKHMPRVYAATAWPQILVSGDSHSGKLRVTVWFALRGIKKAKFDANDIQESLDIDPDEFGKEVIAKTDPAAATIGQFQAVVRSLKQAHWDWIQDGTMKIGPGGVTVGYSASILCYVHYLFKPGQDKPKEFVIEVTRQALKAQGFQIEKIRPSATPGGITILVQVQADAQFSATRFPDLFIDFDTLSLSEAIDPEEIVAAADANSQYVLYRNLQNIAKSLSNDGWVGYIHARAWQKSGNIHEITIRMTRQPVDAQRPMTHTVEADITRAFQGTSDEFVSVQYNSSRIPGYTVRDNVGPWHWMFNTVTSLGGRQPSQFPDGSASVYCDIPTGTISVGAAAAPTVRGVLQPPQPA
ncbi:MAG: hypothetical protein ACOYB3_01175 [Azonexus sp.]